MKKARVASKSSAKMPMKKKAAAKKMPMKKAMKGGVNQY